MDKKISLLVAGGTGFLGYHVLKRAKKENWSLSSLSSKAPKKKFFIKKVKYIKTDLTKTKRLKKYDYDYVINLTGYTNISQNKKIKNIFFKTHFYGLKNLINLLNKKKLKKFIQAGSSLEYGLIKQPQKESSTPKPNTYYGKAKLKCTNYLLRSFNKNKFQKIVLRFFQVYGALQEKNRLLPYVIENSLKNKNFNLTLGNQYRDFCYVDDAVESIFKVLKSKKNLNNKIFNIGYGKSYKIRDIVEIIVMLCGKGRPNFGGKKYKFKENIHLRPDINLAKKYLKWSPKVELLKGLKKTISSYK